MLKRFIVASLFLTSPALAQPQQPSWEDIALQAQHNATSAQVLSTAVVSALQDEIAALKAELAKMQAAKAPETPK